MCLKSYANDSLSMLIDTKFNFAQNRKKMLKAAIDDDAFNFMIFHHYCTNFNLTGVIKFNYCESAN